MNIQTINIAIQEENFEKAVEISTNLLNEFTQNSTKEELKFISEGEVLFRRGYAYFRLQEFQKALRDYNLSIQKAENPDVYSERGVLFFTVGKLAEALVNMNIALDLEPDNPYRYSSRAYIRAAAGMTVLAMQDYRKAVELDPEDAVAHNNLGLLEEKVGYQLKADKRFEKADKLREEQSKEDEMLTTMVDSKISQEEENNAKNKNIKIKESNSVLNQDSKDELDVIPQTYKSALKQMFSSKEAFSDALKKAKDVYFKK
ncbi:tetratricopeptide repeat protein [Bernardetia litoralis DSM 6794]|uniref:Tetratricopeptide repeat protein n=1 Tax=Bernardetia litoralis (strain ATCC 23117 / DSM 6794 / NBRC 15988 / NCIMB 1366 / Fx l1 / Sio-4) TaxID=880071 RepID=I4AH10_BERLS|nr:tetratricopeptide repeat protein [Bernardetia litoralis]AFM03245.1 tetratricopeptide repeat protein [Bernardetia litoralis DSM 6794]